MVFNGVDENRFSLLSLLGENVGEFKDEDRGKYEVRKLKLRKLFFGSERFFGLF